MNTINIAILGLDDDPDDLLVIENLIKSKGIENCHLFKKADEFLSELTKDIHVCILDHYLPGTTGLEILKKVKEKNENSFVILNSGLESNDLKDEYLNNDCDRSVNKNKPDHSEKLGEYLSLGLKRAGKMINFLVWLKEQKENSNVK